MSISERLVENVWNIGFIEQSCEQFVKSSVPMKIHWLKHSYKDRWFADPFILDYDDTNIYVLVEEYIRKEKKAGIALITVARKDYTLSSRETILTEPTHLSFPIIMREGENVFIYPENGESGKLKLYSFDLRSHKVVYKETLFEDYLADAVEIRINNKEYIIATTHPDPNGDVLSFFKKNDGEYLLDRTIRFDQKIARNAGDWFLIGDEIYRPAQNCSLRYGGSMEIQRFDPVSVSFKTIKEIFPISKRYNRGIHTYNHHKSMSVVDGYGYRNPILARFFVSLMNCYHRIRGVEYQY